MKFFIIIQTLLKKNLLDKAPNGGDTSSSEQNR